MPIEIERPQRAKGMVHHQIAATAKGLAEEHYEQLALNNAFYKRWPKVKGFVAHNWRHYVSLTRQMFSAMLGNPQYTPEFKDHIYKALLLDGAVNPKKMAKPAPKVHFPLTKLTKQ